MGGDTYVVHVDLLCSARLGVRLVGGDDEFVAGLDGDLYVSLFLVQLSTGATAIPYGHIGNTLLILPGPASSLDPFHIGAIRATIRKDFASKGE
jgi:hypothetical protein